MKSRSFARLTNIVFTFAVALFLPVVGLGAVPSESHVPDSAPSRAVEWRTASPWSFSLLPRSFQRNPRVDFHVITEKSEAGRQASRPTPDKPIYYNLFVGNALDFGMTSLGQSRAPNLALLEAALRRGLAQLNFLPAEPPSRPSSLLLVCQWGEVSFFEPEAGYDAESSFDTSSGYPLAPVCAPRADLSSPLRARRAALSRARLIGGDKFAVEFNDLLTQADLLSGGTQGPRVPPPTCESILGDLPTTVSIWNPVERYLQRNPKKRSLVMDSMSDCYFVVVCAYDQRSAFKKERLLLWRTKMTVNAESVSMEETLVPLVKNTSAYLGQDMDEACTIATRIDREGWVEYRAPEVLDWKYPDNSSVKRPLRVSPASSTGSDVGGAGARPTDRAKAP